MKSLVHLTLLTLLILFAGCKSQNPRGSRGETIVASESPEGELTFYWRACDNESFERSNAVPGGIGTVVFRDNLRIIDLSEEPFEVPAINEAGNLCFENPTNGEIGCMRGDVPFFIVHSLENDQRILFPGPFASEDD